MSTVKVKVKVFEKTEGTVYKVISITEYGVEFYRQLGRGIYPERVVLTDFFDIVEKMQDWMSPLEREESSN